MSVVSKADPIGIGTADLRLRRRSVLSRRGLLTAAVLSAGLGLPTAAVADSAKVDVKNVSGPTLKVKTDGSNYTALSGSFPAIKVDLHVQLDAGVSGKVKSWKAWPVLDSKHFKDNGKSVTYSIGNRPKKVDRVETTIIAAADYAEVAVAACNSHAQNLRIEGQGNAAIFASQYSLWINVEAGWQYEMTGISGVTPPVEVALNPAVEVICEKAPSWQPVTAFHKNDVESVDLQIDTLASFTGECGLRLLGSLETKGANGTVKFRYVDGDGKKSDVKTVSTGSDKIVDFNHEYPLKQHSGQVSGKVRIEGVSSEFNSSWVDYEADCAGMTGAGSLATSLPPTVKLLEVKVLEYRNSHFYTCPIKVRIRGVLEGRGSVKGAVAILGGTSVAETRLYDIENGEKQYFATMHELDWSGSPGGQHNNHMTVKFTMNATNAVNAIVDSDTMNKTFNCSLLIPHASIGAEVIKREIVGGAYLCPVKYFVRAEIGSGPVAISGDVKIKAGPKYIGFFEYDLKAHQKKELDLVAVDLSWNGVPPTANGLLQQVYLDLFITGGNNDKHLRSWGEDVLFRCTKVAQSSSTGGAKTSRAPGQAQLAEEYLGGNGNLTTGARPNTTLSQQTMGAVKAFQTAPGFNVLQPKGAIKKGVIRLSGGKASSGYSLTFYRKTKGGYKAVRGSGLPRKMTGTSAKFKLGALKGGQLWRLEVCPSGQRGKKACKMSDFRLPALKGSAGVKRK